ncbi:copper resistance protein [Klebsiella pneumoniae]|nr:copper resistance protein [Klebsiella pneumoniae]
MFHTIVSIKNDGHYFCRAGGNRPDGLNEPVTGILIIAIRQRTTIPGDL